MSKAVIFLVKWILIFFIASTVIFSVVRLMPDTPQEQLLAAYHLPASEENLRILEKQLGLDQPLWSQYFNWIGNFLKGNWGTSLVSQVELWGQFRRKLPYSAAIGLGGLIWAIPPAFFLGWGSALRRGGFCDRLTGFLSVVAQAVPNFLLAILIIYVLGVKFKLVKFFTGGSGWSMFFAILLSGLYTVGILARVVKVHYLEEMGKSYMRFTVSRGFTIKYVMLRHGYKPVLYGLLSAVTANFAGVLGGSAVLEFAFGIPGISYFLADSMKARDYAVLQTYILVVVIWMFLVHLVLKLVLGLLDVRSKQ